MHGVLFDLYLNNALLFPINQHLMYLLLIICRIRRSYTTRTQPFVKKKTEKPTK